MDEAVEMHGSSVVAGEATEVFKATEASLDLVTMPADTGIVRNGDLAVAPGRDRRCGVDICCLVAQVVAIMGNA
ncbi:hypothetical protein ASE91_13185 [Sphingomonas sp. Leaf62]|nr:hypothetical protein ASE91_13185 [Sphingomonas sp. Leaf62]